MLSTSERIHGVKEGMEALSWKTGTVLLILGVMHFLNLYVFSKIRGMPELVRRRAIREPPGRGPGRPGGHFVGLCCGQWMGPGSGLRDGGSAALRIHGRGYIGTGALVGRPLGARPLLDFHDGP